MPWLPEKLRSIGASATMFLIGAACTALIALTVNSATDDHLDGPTPTQPVSLEQKQSAPSQTRYLPFDFLETAGDLEDADIAELNLRCALGLPGAEALDIAASLVELDRWAAHVRAETERHLYRFRAAPEEYENSEAYFRMLMLIVVLQGDLGVHYNTDRITEPDFTNSQDLFIHGMINSDNGGTCTSMPPLYVAIGRRLGYPLHLAVTKAHVYVRWDDPTTGEQFNIEGTNRGLNTPDDAHYRNWPHKLTDAEINNGWFLRSLTNAEMLAVFLMTRGNCLEDLGRLVEAQVAYAMAHELAPKSPLAFAFLANAVRVEERAIRSKLASDSHTP